MCILKTHWQNELIKHLNFHEPLFDSEFEVRLVRAMDAKRSASPRTTKTKVQNHRLMMPAEKVIFLGILMKIVGSFGGHTVYSFWN